MPQRYRRASDTTYRALWQHILVTCPQCGRCAKVIAASEGARTGIVDPSAVARVACLHCGYTKTRQPSLRRYERKWGRWIMPRQMERYPGDAPLDRVFGLPLWLQVPCGDELLWAENAAHLDIIEQYIQADLRQPEVKDMTYKLPGWMIQAKHRDEVMRAVARLRPRLEECG